MIIKNNRGVTLFELLVSLAVGSIIVLSLMSILTMAIKAKSRLDYDTKLENNSYRISQTIQTNTFNLGVQEIELVTNTANYVEIDFKHLRDVVVVDGVLSDPDLAIPVIETLIWNGATGQLTYDGVLLHDSDVSVATGSSLEVISYDNTCDFGVTIPCTEGIIKLTLVLTMNFNSETLESRVFITTIII